MTVEQGELDFQVYFVCHRWQPTVTAIRFDGIESALDQPGSAARACDQADVILFGPSNPWLSIAPILGVPGTARTFDRARLCRVSPSRRLFGGAAIKGPAAKIDGRIELSCNRQQRSQSIIMGLSMGLFTTSAMPN